MAMTATFFACTDHDVPVIPDPTQLNVSAPVVTGLRNPIGLTTDESGNMFITEIGTGANDAAIVMVTPGGTKKTIVSGLPSAIGPEGSPEGISHLLYNNGKLYVLHGIAGKLFIVNVAGFTTSSPEIPASSLENFEYGNQIKAFHLASPDNSNLYDLTFGPDGDLYMVDAGSNAVFRRSKTDGNIYLFAVLPKIGPMPGVDAVPTGIVFDGKKFLISTLTGFPFTPGAAKIFAVDPATAVVTPYKENFTTLTHLELTVNNKPLALKFANFGMGFTPNTGAVLDENGNVLASGLMMPTDIKRVGDKEYLLLSMPMGTVHKLTY
jgi:hypothetical protein